LKLRKRLTVTTLVASGLLLLAGCGGTLEGKYRRGQLTTTTTARGNAAGQGRTGEPGSLEAGGTIGVSATGRSVAPPFGGRHR